MTTILITGAAGRIGEVLRPRLATAGRVLRLLDIADLTPGPAEEFVQASVTDLDAVASACAGVSAVIHLAGISGEAPWEQIAAVNIHGTYAVFEAARRASVGRVIFASSNHAVGFHAAVGVPGPRLRLSRTGYLLRRVQGDRRGAGRAVPLPARA